MNIQTKNLKENTIRISTVQFEDDFVGQLGENGNNVKYDPITGREYVYMSANNVKNCMKQTFTTLSMESPLGYLNSDLISLRMPTMITRGLSCGTP